MLVREDSPRYGTPQLIQPRLGQGIFRVAVMDAYSRACAVTQEHSLPALEASHIQPYAKDGPHDVRNGVLLRADLHRLFDQGYVTITPEHRLEVSPRLKEDYQNGRSYYPLHGAGAVSSHICRRCAAALNSCAGTTNASIALLNQEILMWMLRPSDLGSVYGRSE